MKLFWASRAICGLESVSPGFFHVGILRVFKREDMGVQESPAPIRDLGLFRAISTARILIECEGFFLF
jgi:hypothetical protein